MSCAESCKKKKRNRREERYVADLFLDQTIFFFWDRDSALKRLRLAVDEGPGQNEVHAPTTQIDHILTPTLLLLLRKYLRHSCK